MRNLRNLNLICLLLLENLLTFKTCRILNLLLNFCVCQVLKLFWFFVAYFSPDFFTFSLGISCRFIKKEKTHNAAFFSIKSFSNNKSRLINIRLTSLLSFALLSWHKQLQPITDINFPDERRVKSFYHLHSLLIRALKYANERTRRPKTRRKLIFQ